MFAQDGDGCYAREKRALRDICCEICVYADWCAAHHAASEQCVLGCVAHATPHEGEIRHGDVVRVVDVDCVCARGRYARDFEIEAGEGQGGRPEDVYARTRGAGIGDVFELVKRPLVKIYVDSTSCNIAGNYT